MHRTHFDIKSIATEIPVCRSKTEAIGALQTLGCAYIPDLHLKEPHQMVAILENILGQKN